MNLKNVMFAAVIGLMATPMFATANDHDSAVEKTGDYVSDAALTTKVKSVLALESELSAIDISVESTDNVVTLTGDVENDAQVELAEKVVSDVDGVKSVHNELSAP